MQLSASVAFNPVHIHTYIHTCTHCLCLSVVLFVALLLPAPACLSEHFGVLDCDTPLINSHQQACGGTGSLRDGVQHQTRHPRTVLGSSFKGCTWGGLFLLHTSIMQQHSEDAKTRILSYCKKCWRFC